jgi:hypothetical protein
MNGRTKTTPKRIQRSRVKGWRMPEGAIYVGRTTARFGRSVDYGNRYVIGETVDHVDRRALFVTDAKVAAGAYREWLLWQIDKGYPPDLAALRGRDLACWCPLDQPCHADVLLEIANAGR